FINKVLMEYLDKFIIIYINNILIYNNNIIEYKLYIYLIFKKLRVIGLQAIIYKYKFYIIKIKFFRFIITTDSIYVNLIKIIIIIK
ncbi:hypothetical protein BO78DRAFT_312123, partial [Aspergillus sclerotiicarbonarius CBS 121057]